MSKARKKATGRNRAKLATDTAGRSREGLGPSIVRGAGSKSIPKPVADLIPLARKRFPDPRPLKAPKYGYSTCDGRTFTGNQNYDSVAMKARAKKHTIELQGRWILDQIGLNEEPVPVIYTSGLRGLLATALARHRQRSDID